MNVAPNIAISPYSCKDRSSKEEGQFRPTAYTPWLGSRERTSSERMLPSVIGHVGKLVRGVRLSPAEALQFGTPCFPGASPARHLGSI